MPLDHTVLRRAAEILEEDAQCLFDSHTKGDGTWPREERETKKRYEEMRDVAARLRKQARL